MKSPIIEEFNKSLLLNDEENIEKKTILHKDNSPKANHPDPMYISKSLRSNKVLRNLHNSLIYEIFADELKMLDIEKKDDISLSYFFLNKGHLYEYQTGTGELLHNNTVCTQSNAR